MDIKTKYSLNDTVYLIRNKPLVHFEKCGACSGDGVVVLNDEKTRTCPECYGRKGFSRNGPDKWQIEGSLRIGQVRAKITNIKSDGMFDNVGDYSEGCTESEIEYMAYETGVGSGTIHDESNLFPTYEEAESECANRNETEQH